MRPPERGRPERPGRPGRLCGVSRAALLLALLALAGCDAEAGAGAEPPAPLRVRTAEVVAVPDRLVIREVARLEPWRRVTVSAEVAGRLTRMTPELGERVPEPSPEQPLVEIERRPYRAGLERAEAAAAAADARVEWAGTQRRRVLELFGRGQAAEAERDRVELEARVATAELESARAALDEAALQLERTVVALPAGYRVTGRHAEPGEVVVPAQPLVTLIDDRTLRLGFEVAPELIPILLGDPLLEFEVKGLTGAWAARVIRVGPEADPASGRFPVEAVIDNDGGLLLAGMTAVARIVVERSTTPLLTVPRAAVLVHLEQGHLLVVGPDGVVERRAVRRVRAPQLEAGVLGVEGVAAGERVAIERIAELRTGDRVVAATSSVSAAERARPVAPSKPGAPGPGAPGPGAPGPGAPGPPHELGAGGPRDAAAAATR